MLDIRKVCYENVVNETGGFITSSIELYSSISGELMNVGCLT